MSDTDPAKQLIRAQSENNGGEEELKEWFVIYRALFCLKDKLLLQ